MKKIFAILAFTAVVFGACTPTVTPVTVALSPTSASEVGLATSHKHMMITLTNSTSQEATINWERSETQSVTGWTYMVNNNSGMSGTVSIAAGASKTVEFMITPNSISGTGSGSIKFYDVADQNATMKTFTYNFSTVASFFNVVEVDPTTGTVRANDPSKDYHMKVVNPNTASITVNWAFVSNSANPSAWTVNVCDPIECLLPSVVAGNFAVSPGDSAEFKFTIAHNQTTGGPGGVSGMFYVASDSANSVVNKVISHTVNP